MEEVVNYIVEQKKNGVDYSEIRIELTESGVPEEELKYYIEQADVIVVDSLEIKQPFPYKFINIYAGYFLIGFGILIMMLAYVDGIDLGASFMVLYGPILTGFSMVLYQKNSKQLEKREARKRFNRK